MTLTETYSNHNPLKYTFIKDEYTLEIREKNYFVLVKGQVVKQGVRLSKDLKDYFGV